MANIFISYKSEDRETVRLLAGALADVGLEAWWDQELRGGDTWSPEIRDRVENSDVVLGVWSNKSIDAKGNLSQGFVSSEHSVGRQKLIPVLIDRVNPPFGYEYLQAEDLTGWSGDKGTRAFSNLVERISVRLTPTYMIKKLDGIETELRQSRRQVDILSSKLDNLAHENASLQQGIADLLIELKSTKMQFVEAQSKILTLERFTEQVASVEATASEIQRLRTELSQKSAETLAAHDDLQTQLAELDRRKVQIDQLRAQNSSLTKRLASAEAETQIIAQRSELLTNARRLWEQAWAPLLCFIIAEAAFGVFLLWFFNR